MLRAGAGFGIPDANEIDIQHTNFTNNAATNYGGGLTVSAGNIFLRHVTFSLNTASWGAGMAIYDTVELSAISLRGIHFVDNVATDHGHAFSFARGPRYGIVPDLPFMDLPSPACPPIGPGDLLVIDIQGACNGNPGNRTAPLHTEALYGGMVIGEARRFTPSHCSYTQRVLKAV
jgi:hypothetical protein